MAQLEDRMVRWEVVREEMSGEVCVVWVVVWVGWVGG